MNAKAELQIALYQMDSIWKSPAQNLQQLATHLETLPPITDLVVLPEMWTTGFVMDPAEVAHSTDSPLLQQIRALAIKHQVDIVGTLAIRELDTYYNRAVLHTADGQLHTYDKQYLFTPSGEHTAYSAGEQPSTINYRGWKLQLRICYDLRFPASNDAQEVPDLILYMANWPAARIYHWDQLLIARAIENQCYVVGCNRIGTDGNGWTFPGHSQVIDATGQVLTHISDTTAGARATLSKLEQEGYRSKFPFYKDKKQA